MIIEGKFKSDAKGRLGGRPYRLDFGLDSAYIQVLSRDPVYSDYVALPDRGPFRDIIAMVDFDKNNQVVGFTIEGMLESYRASSLRRRLEIDFGLFAARTLETVIKDRVVEYLQEYLPTLLDSQGHLAVSGAYA